MDYANVEYANANLSGGSGQTHFSSGNAHYSNGNVQFGSGNSQSSQFANGGLRYPSGNTQQLGSAGSNYSQNRFSNKFEVDSVSARANARYSSKLTDNERDDGLGLPAQPDQPGALIGVMEEQPADGQFVAGEAFFNYAALGSLRPDAVPVNIFSREFIGFPISVCMGGIVYTWSHYLFLNTFTQQWNPAINPTANNILKLMKWVSCISVVMGLLSDCFPIFRYRRKSYIIVGWLMAFFATIGVLLIYCLVGFQTSTTAVTIATLFVVVAWTGVSLVWIIAAAMAVEYAQREPLESRGNVVTTVFMMSYGSMAVCMVPVASIVSFSPNKAMLCKLDFGSIALIQAIICLVAIPFLIYRLKEDRVPPCRARVAIFRRLHELWGFLAQRAVYSIIFGLGTMIVFSAGQIYDWGNTMMLWTHFNTKYTMWMYLTYLIAHSLFAGAWRFLMINKSWRAMAASVVIFGAVMKALTSCLIIYDVWRSPVVYISAIVAGHITIALIAIMEVITTTEITYLGREAAVVGMLDSICNITWIAATAFWPWLQKHMGGTVMLVKDTPEARKTLTTAVLVISVLSVLSTLMVYVFPVQKLDAQQMRAFGGYHWLPRIAIPLLMLVLLLFDLALEFTQLLK